MNTFIHQNGRVTDRDNSYNTLKTYIALCNVYALRGKKPFQYSNTDLINHYRRVYLFKDTQ